MRTRTVVLALAAAALLPSLAAAQQPTRRRQAPITIRGTVPTPQVVTVRPREVPTYQRNILVPNFYDRDFWAVILPAYLVVPERMVTGEPPLGAAADGVSADSAAGLPSPAGGALAPADSAGSATTLPPLPPRPSRPFTRASGAAAPRTTPAPAGGTTGAPAPATPGGATSPGGASPSGAPASGASGTAPASSPR